MITISVNQVRERVAFYRTRLADDLTQRVTRLWSQLEKRWNLENPLLKVSQMADSERLAALLNQWSTRAVQFFPNRRKPAKPQSKTTKKKKPRTVTAPLSRSRSS